MALKISYCGHNIAGDSKCCREQLELEGERYKGIIFADKVIQGIPTIVGYSERWVGFAEVNRDSERWVFNISTEPFRHFINLEDSVLWLPQKYIGHGIITIKKDNPQYKRAVDIVLERAVSGFEAQLECIVKQARKKDKDIFPPLSILEHLTENDLS